MQEVLQHTHLQEKVREGRRSIHQSGCRISSSLSASAESVGESDGQRGSHVIFVQCCICKRDGLTSLADREIHAGLCTVH